MSVTDITSKAQFDELIKSTPYVAVQAHATWCGPCKAIAPFFNKFAGTLGQEKYKFVRFDTDEVPDLSFELNIRSIPAFFFFENGDKVNDMVGPKPPVLQKALEDLSAKAKADGPTLSTNEDF